MKFRFEMIYRLGLALLLFIAFWSVWASAEPIGVTNAPAFEHAAAATEVSEASTNQFQGFSFA